MAVSIREWFSVQVKTAKPGGRKIPSVEIRALIAARRARGENARRTGHSTLQRMNWPLDRLDVCSLLALRPLLHFEAHFLVFLQRFETVSLYLREMCEQVLSAAVRRDKAEAFRVVEPLYCACFHHSIQQSIRAHLIPYA